METSNHRVRPKNILIYGSCVTRDIFRFLEADAAINIVAYFARSSLGSFSENPCPHHDVFSKNLKSPFQRRLIEADFTKKLALELSTNQIEFDELIVDFIDERFSIFEFPDSSICTVSVELLEAGFSPNGTDGKIIPSRSEEFYERWERGWSYLVEVLKQHGQLSKLRINKAYWACCAEDGSDFLPYYPFSMIKEANAFLDRLYMRAKEDLTEEQFYSSDEENFIGNPHHLWGKSPFHYIDQYYTDMLNQILPSKRTAELTGYNINQWDKSVFPHQSIDAFLNEMNLPDGIHQIEIPGQLSIDIWIQGLLSAKKNGSPAILVGLSGAVTNRNNKSAPFFSGLALATEMRLPIISISDPSLALDNEIALSWYAGNKWVIELPKKIAKILDAIGAHFNIPLVIFGGSGAGFAGLALSTLLNTKAKILVWNPQTSISAYHWRPVSKYIATAFPEHNQLTENIETKPYNKRSEFLHKLLEETGITHQVSIDQVNDNISLLYLQNRSDTEHVLNHAARFCESSSWRRVGQCSFCTTTGDNAIFFGEWGDGHAYPPRKLLVESIKTLIISERASDVAKALERESNRLEVKIPFFHWFCDHPKAYIQANAIMRNEIISVTCSMADETIDPAGLQYAYYLLKDGHKIQSKWYSTDPFAEFTYENSTANLEVIVFTKGVFGEAVPLGTYPVTRQSIA